MDDPPAIAVRDEKITQPEIDRILSEVNGVSALIVLMRNNKVDPDLAIKAIAQNQNQSTSKAKRMILALIEAILPS
jgi:hypothetical protein